jgi:hypothetical protein
LLVQTFLRDFQLVFVGCLPGHPDDLALRKVLAFVVPVEYKNIIGLTQYSQTYILRAIPFNIHTPLWTRSIKFKPLRKKDQSADTNTPPRN